MVFQVGDTVMVREEIAAYPVRIQGEIVKIEVKTDNNSEYDYSVSFGKGEMWVYENEIVPVMYSEKDGEWFCPFEI